MNFESNGFSRALGVCCLLAFAACPSSTTTLHIDLITTFSPGDEFDTIHLEVSDRFTDQRVDLDADYANGARIATVTIEGDVRVRVVLFNDGAPIAMQDLFVTAQTGTQVVRIRIVEELPDAGVDGAVDGGVDGGAGVDCQSMSNGASCGEDLICLLGECVSTRCGDGFTDPNNGEACDQASDVPVAGCLPSCQFECESSPDCADADLCTLEICVDHACRVEDPRINDGNACEDEGTCSVGLCAAPGCGNGIVDGGEACDDGNRDNNDGCRSDCTATCVEDADCSNGNPCDGEERCEANICGPAAALLDCDDGEPCTEDRCSIMGCQNFFIDEDGDGFAPMACASSDLSGEDCDDSDATTNPMATELCDTLDHNCDGDPSGGVVDVTCLRDQDMDGYGNPSDSMVGCACPVGYVPPRADGRIDCEDGLTSVNPGESVFHENPFGAGSYDYNCDGEETRRYVLTGTGCVLAGGGGRTYCVGSGWVGSIPVCGETGTYESCHNVTCSSSSSERVQQCR